MSCHDGVVRAGYKDTLMCSRCRSRYQIPAQLPRRQPAKLLKAHLQNVAPAAEDQELWHALGVGVGRRPHLHVCEAAVRFALPLRGRDERTQLQSTGTTRLRNINDVEGRASVEAHPSMEEVPRAKPNRLTGPDMQADAATTAMAVYDT